MIDLDMSTLVTAIAISEPLNTRTVAFNVPTLDLLKSFLHRLESLIPCDTGNAEVLKYLIHTHPEMMVAL